MASPGGTHRARLGPGFRWLLSAASVSSLGDGLAVVALPLLATRLTSDPRLIAGLLFAQRVPWLVLALSAGAVADRFPRLRLMRAADVARAMMLLAVGAASVSGQLSLVSLYLVALALGSAETVFSTASQATLPDLVAPGQLDRANGYLFSTQMGGEQLVGPALGGLVFAASRSAPLLADGFSFLASAVLLSQVGRSLARTRAASVVADGGAAPEPGIRAGLRVFRSVPVLRVLLVLMSGLGLCQAMVLGLLVLYGTRTLHLGPVGYGVFIAAGSTGNVVGGITVAGILKRVSTATMITVAALAAAAAYLVLASTSSVVIAGGAFVIEAFAVACGTVATMTIRQSAVPAQFRGRIASIFRLAIFGAVPLGALAGGLLAAAAGIRTALVVAGTAQLVLAMLTAHPIRQRLPSAPEIEEDREPEIVRLVDDRPDPLPVGAGVQSY